MRSEIITLVLALSVAWAQTGTQTNPSAPQQSTTSSEKEKCSCCEKKSSGDMGGDMKDMHGCCSHHDDAMAGEYKDMASHHDGMASCCSGKEGSSCCAGKDAASCMKDKDAAGKSCCGDECSKDKTTASCCGDKVGANKCGKDGAGCCSSGKKSAMNCCREMLHS